jgi:hypothetical protein
MKTHLKLQPLSRIAGTLVFVAALVLPLAGCGKKAGSSGQAASSAKASSEKAAAGTPVVEPVLNAFRQNDSAAAVRLFVATDWSARPLFEPGSTMSLSENQFKSLAEADQRKKSAEATTADAELTRLAQAVVQAGRDAAAGNDLPLARKHFTALKQFGEALDSADTLLITKLRGRALKKMADKEMEKSGQ